MTYTDGCAEMLAEGVRLHPELEEEARVALFPLCDGDLLLAERFHLVVCVAVIMHLNDAALEQLASQLASVCALEGHLVLSHSCGRSGLIGERNGDGTLFRERPAEDVTRVFTNYGFEIGPETQDSDGLGRGDISWTTQVMHKTT